MDPGEGQLLSGSHEWSAKPSQCSLQPRVLSCNANPGRHLLQTRREARCWVLSVHRPLSTYKQPRQDIRGVVWAQRGALVHGFPAFSMHSCTHPQSQETAQGKKKKKVILDMFYMLQGLGRGRGG